MHTDSTLKNSLFFEQGGQRGLVKASVIISVVLINILSLIFPVFIINVYDSVIVKHDRKALIGLIIATVIALCVDFALKTLKTICDNWRTARNSYLLEKKQLENFDDVAVDDFIQKGVGDYLGKLNKLKYIRDYQQLHSTSVMIDMPFLALYFIFLCFISIPLAMLVALSLMGFFAFAKKYHIDNTENIEAQDLLSQKKQSYLYEIFKSVSTIKTQAMEGLIQRRYDRLNGNFFRKELETVDRNQKFANISSLYNQVLIASIVTLGAILIINNSITSGFLIAAIFITARMSQPIYGILQYIKLKKMAEPVIREYEKEIKKNAPCAESLKEISSITLEGLNGNVSTLDSVKPNIWLVGGMTLYQLYMCLIKEISDANIKVQVNGKDINAFSSTSVEQKIIYLSRRTRLMPGSILDNLCLYDKKNNLQVLQLLEHSGLGKFINFLPDGILTQPDINGDVLYENRSIKIYLLILQALVNFPEVLIIDSNMRNSHSIEPAFFNIVKNICKSNQIILITTDSKFR